MNDIINTSNQTPIEIALGIDENGMTTARKLYKFLELGEGQFSRWSKANIENNEFYEEGKDWEGFDIVSNGNKCRDYRITTDFAKHLSMESHSAKGKIARNYFVAVEDKSKQLAIDRSQLSPQTQALMSLVEGQARQELEQKRQAEQIQRIEQTVHNMKKELTEPIGDWRSEINAKVREISIKSGIGYQDIFTQMYGELEQTAHCSLKRLCDNKRDRMERAGNTKTCIKNETTKIAIIEGKPQLKAIFESIVRRYAMSYCA